MIHSCFFPHLHSLGPLMIHFLYYPFPLSVVTYPPLKYLSSVLTLVSLLHHHYYQSLSLYLILHI
jgi:hypothetical protein